MKTDTEESVRITVTFNRYSNPEWFAVLSQVSSGRARSEIVKAHLNLPSKERFGAAAGGGVGKSGAEGQS